MAKGTEFSPAHTFTEPSGKVTPHDFCLWIKIYFAAYQWKQILYLSGFQSLSSSIRLSKDARSRVVLAPFFTTIALNYRILRGMSREF
jgi:hypothetical protein